jgi:signal transduction histidine kinase
MRRRARELGAGLSMRSGDDGTVVALSVPLSMRPAAHTDQSN